MANKRVFKKSVEELADITCGVIVSSFNALDGNGKKVANEVFEKVVSAAAAAKSNADKVFGKKMREFGSAKEYLNAKKDFYKELFNNIQSDFSKEVNEALKEFNAVLPAQAKEDNKKAVAN